MNLTELTNYPRDKIRSLVGLIPEALGELLLTAPPGIERRRQKQQADKPKRKRKTGGGRKCLTKQRQEYAHFALPTLLFGRIQGRFQRLGRQVSGLRKLQDSGLKIREPSQFARV